MKSVPWAFFVASLRFATSSLIANATLVTKVYLPREVFPIAAVLSQFADFCVASATLVVVLAFTGVGGEHRAPVGPGARPRPGRCCASGSACSSRRGRSSSGT